MSSDSKFFIGVAIAAVVVVGVIVLVTTRHNTPSKITTTVSGSYGHTTDNASAPITVVEFGDFECPYCGQAEPAVEQMLKDHTNVKFQFINFPLPQHANALPAARAAEAAADQNQYWAMHNWLYANQSSWVNLSNPDQIFESYARQLGLNMGQFESDYNSSTIKNLVQKDENYGTSLGVNQTPTFYVNGKQVLGIQTTSDWNNLIAAAAK